MSEPFAKVKHRTLVPESAQGVVMIDGEIMHVDYPGFCQQWADRINAAFEAEVKRRMEEARAEQKEMDAKIAEALPRRVELPSVAVGIEMRVGDEIAASIRRGQ